MSLCLGNRSAVILFNLLSVNWKKNIPYYCHYLKSLHFFNGQLNVKRNYSSIPIWMDEAFSDIHRFIFIHYIYPYVCSKELLAQGHTTKSGTRDVLNMHLDIQSASVLVRVVKHTYTICPHALRLAFVWVWLLCHPVIFYSGLLYMSIFSCLFSLTAPFPLVNTYTHTHSA